MHVDTRAPPRPGARWIRGTFAGWSAGFILAIVFVLAAEAVGLRSVQFPLALGMGAGVGFVQARLLAPWLGRRGSWLAATALGLALPFVVADAARLAAVPIAYSLAAYVGLGGVTAGLLQWRLLRRISNRAAWWLVASPIGWTLGASTVAINEHLLPRIPGLLGALLYVGIVLAGGLLVGVTGAAALGFVLAAPREAGHPRPAVGRS